MKAPLISLTHPSLHIGHHNIESFIWNIIIRHNVQSSYRVPTTINSPISIYLKMRFRDVNPDFHTFPFLLPAFNSPSHLLSGRSIHAQVLRFGFGTDPFVQTCLINMYSSCRELGDAHRVFDEITDPGLPSWNSMINRNVKAGLIGVARKMFDEMPERNVISWSCMIDGYVKCGGYREALSLFRDMQVSNDVMPNEFTVSSVLSACGKLGALEHGKWVHAYMDKCGLKVDVVLGTSLIEMYAKCGSIERAKEIFDNLGSKKDVMAWSALMSGLAMHGHGEECLDLFTKMTIHGVRPNAITFLGVLSACVHGGLVIEGKDYFRMMSEMYGITPLIQHYGCLVDLYGRAGMIGEAWKCVKSMPMEPDVIIWGALLSGAKMKGDTETCEIALKKLIELEPTNSGAYVLLSNVYAKTGKWMDVRHVRNQMEEKGIKKVPGCSWVEYDGVLHEFFAADKTHPQTKEIYMMLGEIMKKLKMGGYVCDTKEVLFDLDEERKEIALSLHSEKLAIAFCFLKTSSGTPIRIIKNLRICGDCHVAIKMISQVYGREIVVRDCTRFHRFVDGLCSCNDYW